MNLHTFAGTGNGMGNISNAYMNKTPLIILGGNQTREMLVGDVYLTNVEETVLPKPWVKWSYQPVRAEDVPAAIMRAYAAALQPPAGPVFSRFRWTTGTSLRWAAPPCGPSAPESPRIPGG